MVATPLTVLSVGDTIKLLPAPVAADNTNGNTFPTGSSLYVENGTGAQSIVFTPAVTVSGLPLASVTLPLVANSKYRIPAKYFTNLFPAGTVTFTASAATVLVRAEN